VSAIHLENLVKKFGDFTALKTFDLKIANGEFMALLGPSGCGKSTTVNMVAGMEEPTSGRILFGERDMAGVPMGKRGVGFVFQSYAIFTHIDRTPESLLRPADARRSPRRDRSPSRPQLSFPGASGGG
jgi:multiple sugar transport system ATP-binding protein